MKVRMLVDISGTLNGRPYPRKGEVGDVPGPVADHLVSNRYAEFVDSPKPRKVEVTETAAADPVVEKAVKPTVKIRKTPES
jgi:hypothetical protein